jgi:hypothetical protein
MEVLKNGNEEGCEEVDQEEGEQEEEIGSTRSLIIEEGHPSRMAFFFGSTKESVGRTG